MKRAQKVKELQKLASGGEFIISDAIITKMEQKKLLTKQVNSKAANNKECLFM